MRPYGTTSWGKAVITATLAPGLGTEGTITVPTKSLGYSYSLTDIKLSVKWIVGLHKAYYQVSLKKKR